ncbi:SepA family multidrug efflux transporter [Staphylococcus auricularis]|uniref:SepA family multidrug efflux transporter n=1 Tax=Staphylococcus auricularis TaxID=29379 RepID=UPI00242F7EBB|nr:SepA family multidrug efflux transporter [Staphylococcus auricularis]
MKYVRYILTRFIVLSIFILSGATFLVFLGFGLYGLSRILLYLNLADFTYDKGFFNNLVYYGSYIILGYFVLFFVEHTMDFLRKKVPNNAYFNGMTYHLISCGITVLLFYSIVHIHYTNIKIDFWVVMLIIVLLYVCKEVFYPDGENLNKK